MILVVNNYVDFRAASAMLLSTPIVLYFYSQQDPALRLQPLLSTAIIPAGNTPALFLMAAEIKKVPPQNTAPIEIIIICNLLNESKQGGPANVPTEAALQADFPNHVTLTRQYGVTI
jgi:hypothetical protein